MTTFIIIAGTMLVVNFLFLFGSLVYTFKYKSKELLSATRQSIAHSILSTHERRISGQPQVALFHTFVRVSEGNLPYDEQLNITEKPALQETGQQEDIKQK